MGRSSLAVLALGLVFCLLPAGTVLRGDDVLLQIDDAFVSYERSRWTIGNHLVRYSLAREGNNVRVRAIADPLSDRDWNRSEQPDSVFSANGQRVEIGSELTQFLNATVSEHSGGVRLDLRYRVPSVTMDATRSYAVYPGSSVIETWTTYHVIGTRSVTLGDLSSYNLSIENGRLRWVTGLKTPVERGGPFTVNEDEVVDGQTFELGSKGRASEEHVPWFSVRSGEAQFFGAMLWGGSWNLKLRRNGDTLGVQLGLPSFATSLGPGGTLEAPHAIFGLTNAFVPETSMALRSFIEKGLRRGRPHGSYVSYNTWHSYGTRIDEVTLLNEMSVAAALGVEQFVVDAGWWIGVNPDDRGDFARNWGTWRADPERFPNGLGALSDRAHELGMRFGIWVEPERVAMSTLGQSGLVREPFLATENGGYQPGLPNSQAVSAQVCLADSGAREWLLSTLLTFIEEARPDYVKWDNNFWVNCTRTSHGHGAQDGNFQHMRGLRSILERIREAYPNLEIENGSGGGNRLSLDMLAYSDAASLDDHTFPAARVRHATQGLLGLFPSPYLLSSAITLGEAIDKTPSGELSYALRSRMSGSLGISLVVSAQDEDARAGLATEIALYKRIRPILQDSTAILLGRQPVASPDQPWSGWDVVEHVSRRTGDAVLLAFETPGGPPSAVVYPKALRQDAMYDVESADYGMLGSSTGAALMAQGIELLASGTLRGRVLILRVRARE